MRTTSTLRRPTDLARPSSASLRPRLRPFPVHARPRQEVRMDDIAVRVRSDDPDLVAEHQGCVPGVSPPGRLGLQQLTGVACGCARMAPLQTLWTSIQSMSLSPTCSPGCRRIRERAIIGATCGTPLALLSLCSSPTSLILDASTGTRARRSNFELGDMDFFRSEAYSEYFKHLDRAGGFSYERWGGELGRTGFFWNEIADVSATGPCTDAPVHSLAVSLFLRPDKVHWFHECVSRRSCHRSETDLLPVQHRLPARAVPALSARRRGPVRVQPARPFELWCVAGPLADVRAHRLTSL